LSILIKSVAKLLFAYGGLARLKGTAFQRHSRSFLNQVDFEHFRRSSRCQNFRNRIEMFEFVLDRIGRNEPVTVLEFGVSDGESMKLWLAMNSNLESRFYGFDSFEGLPEDWDADRKKGLFDRGGVPPQLEDKRVYFIKGWFDQTLPAFISSFCPESGLVIHLDADLYSSTLFALLHLAPFMRPGTVLVFDEFYDRDHEFKAFCDFTAISRKSYRVLGEVDNFSKVCFEITALNEQNSAR
jgi:O-methyltransferase